MRFCDGHTYNYVPTVVSVVLAKTATTPVDPFDAQNNISRTLNSNSVAMVVWQNNNSLPIVVERSLEPIALWS
jgi:hypothetical protein